MAAKALILRAFISLLAQRQITSTHISRKPMARRPMYMNSLMTESQRTPAASSRGTEEMKLCGLLGDPTQPSKPRCLTTGPRSLLKKPTFIVLLTGEPEAGVEVTQHVLVLARLPNVVDSVGQLFPLDPGQLLFLLRRQRHVGDRDLGVLGRGL
ncbi:hypothetical protein INR49_006498 [Caranx melampygus]|nr:hypothetical protein INR49_006498 [Caranx melampygus]